MDIAAIALAGMETAQKSFDTAARKLASPDQAADVVDLSTEMVSMLAAKNQFTANVQVVKTADEMQKRTVDLLG